MAARVDTGRPEPRVPLRDLECQNNKKFQISIIYCLAATPSSTSLCRTNSLLINTFDSYTHCPIPCICLKRTNRREYTIRSLDLRGDLERLEGPGGRVRHRRVPRGRAEAVQGAERSGRARGAPRARAVDLPPAHFR